MSARDEVMNEKAIQKAIAVHLGINYTVIPNVSFYGFHGSYEADLIWITDREYLTEVEIKCSIGDFRRDFQKHFYHSFNKVRTFYYALPKQLFDSHKKEITMLSQKMGAGLIIIDDNARVYFHQKPIARKEAEKLTIEEKIKYLRVGCLKWWTRE